MNSGTTSTASAIPTDSTLDFWPRFRAAFGPALVGLIGGALTVGITCAAMLPVLRNVATTYNKYPSLQAPWLARDFSLPAAVLVPLVVVGVMAPFGMGLATVRLVRPKDRWEMVSAGLTTAVTGSATAYVLWIGWVVTLSMVVVPSIADLTLLANSTRTPVEATAHPSDALTNSYPDLTGTPADERGRLFFPKIVSDQVVGSAYGVWYGVVVSLVVIGIPAFCGTLAATWLRRRGGSRCSVLFSYVELTVVTSVSLALLLSVAVGIGYPAGHAVGGLQLVFLTTISGAVVTGVIGRWEWPLRVTAAASWGFALFGAGFEDSTSTPTTFTAYGVYCGFAALLARHWWLRSVTYPPVASSVTRRVMPA